MKQDRISPPVQVTHSALPPLEVYLECVRDIFASHRLSNQGKYAQALEQALKTWLGEPNLAICANGTLALQLALRMLGLNGKKVITTPFTYVATLSSLLWEGCTPVFADIDPQTLCIDPLAVERRLGEHPDAAGILAVHVYGNACDVDALDALARRHELYVLYDAAHAFGSRLYGKSLFSYGNAATCSFHATKLFHTVEGGCIVTHSAADLRRLGLLRAFGHRNDEHICLGINAKLSELHAAMGVCLLPLVPEMIEKRQKLCAAYDAALEIGVNPLVRRPRMHPGLEWNYAYYPVIFADAKDRQKALAALKAENIHPRRYFYPSLSKLPYFPSPPCPVSEDIAERVLCLPLAADMDAALVPRIAGIVLDALKN